MLLSVLLGMGMPAVPAYINVALLMGPVLSGLGISIFAAHMFIFYFAVASAITPPVALAAFAAASITKQDPMRTGFSAVRSGIVMFVIPFVFALYPEILLIPQAQFDPSSIAGSVTYLKGYDGSIDWQALLWLLARLSLALYLMASALARYDRSAMPVWQSVVRLAICALILFYNPLVHIPAMVAGLGLVGLSHRPLKLWNPT